VDRKDVPEDIETLKVALTGSKVVCGTGYYLREGDIVYTCWTDSRPVLAMSVAYPGHASDTKVTRRIVEPSTRTLQQQQISRPLIIEKHNKYMGGVISPTIIIMYSGRHCATGRHYSTTIVDRSKLDSSGQNQYVMQPEKVFRPACNTWHRLT